eukprot:303078-Hanusia_phi.AAC.1
MVCCNIPPLATPSPPARFWPQTASSSFVLRARSSASPYGPAQPAPLPAHPTILTQGYGPHHPTHAAAPAVSSSYPPQAAAASVSPPGCRCCSGSRLRSPAPDRRPTPGHGVLLAESRHERESGGNMAGGERGRSRQRGRWRG